MQASKQRGNNVFVGQDGNLYMGTKNEWKVWRNNGWVPFEPPANPNVAVAANSAGNTRARAEYWQSLGRDQYSRQRSAERQQSLGSGNRANTLPRNYIHRGWW